MSILNKLQSKKLIQPPKWLPDNCMYLTIMGSEAYGVSSGDSDKDLYGFCIPEKDMVFPHLRGEILGFGRQVKRFEQWQEHHIFDPDANGGVGITYDFSIYSIVKYFQLLMENNPNMIDSIYTPPSCVLMSTAVGQLVRDNRDLFLHKGVWHKFKGYAYSQLHKMDIKTPQEGSKRATDIAEHGFDTKFAYHVVRLLLEVEMILAEGTLDLQRNREHLKAIRRGEWTEVQIREYFTTKEKQLEELYHSSKLPYSPDEDKIKQLLVDCLEHHYGSLSGCLVQPDLAWDTINQIEELIQKARSSTT